MNFACKLFANLVIACCWLAYVSGAERDVELAHLLHSNEPQVIYSRTVPSNYLALLPGTTKLHLLNLLDDNAGIESLITQSAINCSLSDQRELSKKTRRLGFERLKMLCHYSDAARATVPEVPLIQLVSSVNSRELQLVDSLLAQEVNWINDLYIHLAAQSSIAKTEYDEVRIKRRFLYEVFTYVKQEIEKADVARKSLEVLSSPGDCSTPMDYSDKRINRGRWAIGNMCASFVAFMIIGGISLQMSPEKYKIDGLNDYCFPSAFMEWQDSFIANCTNESKLFNVPCNISSLTSSGLYHCCNTISETLCKEQKLYFNSHIYPQKAFLAQMPLMIGIPVLIVVQTALQLLACYYRRAIRTSAQLKEVVVKHEAQMQSLDPLARQIEANYEATLLKKARGHQ